LTDRRRLVAAALAMGIPAAAVIARAASVRPRPGHPFFAGAPLLIAHRGGMGLAPENTVLAFERAVRWWGADVVELDVHLSRDGEVVVIHDATVDRTTDGSGAVGALSLAELQALDAGHRFTSDGGASFPFRGRGARIPTLDEALRVLARTRVIVEIKDGRVQDRLAAVLRSHGAEQRVLIAASDIRHRQRLRSYPGAVSASASELMQFHILHRLHATGLFQPRVDAIQIPERHEGRELVDARLVREAHALNLPVHVWTVNRPEDMRRLLGWGADGIVTDRPDLLADLLHELVGRPLPPGPPPTDG
jgi:glycerophosphoryl diester phosphodiesterase